MSRHRPHPERSSEDSAQRTVHTIVRRDLLKGSAGVAVLLASPDVFSAKHAIYVPPKISKSKTSGSAAAVSPQPYFFIYGIPGPEPSPGPSLGAGRASAFKGAMPVALEKVATQLAAAPVESPDASTLALVSVDEASGIATVTVVLVDRLSGSIVSSGKLTLPEVKEGALLLVTPTFSSDSATVSLVLSITVPTNQRLITKPTPGTGKSQLIPSATWTCHHELAYFNRHTASFTGPYNLSDAPSLPRVNVGADSEALFLWTLEEVLYGTKSRPQPAPVPRLTAFALGSRASQFSVPAPGPWPVNGEPVATLPSGDILRLVYGYRVQVYSARSGAVSEFDIEPLKISSAKPGRTTMQLRPDGLIFLAKPVIGRAVLVDPARSFKVVSAISFPLPFYATGGPASKAVLAADGKHFYTLGGATVGGLTVYNVSDGSLAASYSHGENYTGLYQLASGTLLATSIRNPRLSFFSPSLTPGGTGDTDLYVTAVF
jgi:hypothetical protein